MKKYLLLILIGINPQYIEIISPESLKFRTTSMNSLQNSFIGSLSSFGIIPFDQPVTVQVFLPEEKNRYGCNPLNPPLSLFPDQAFTFLLERGKCSFLEKAINSKQSGAFTVLVSSNEQILKTLNLIPNQIKIGKIMRGGYKYPTDFNFKKKCRRYFP